MKKLIYFTLGNNVNYLKIANLCIKSLYKTGYDGDFLFITNLKKEILENISFSKPPLFLEIGESNLLHSSANKLKLYLFDKSNEYDKIIFSDLDILWIKNPNSIFDKISNDEFYISNENSLMSDEWWGAKTLNSTEKFFVNNNNIKGVNAGIFAFNKNMVPHLESIDKYFQENINLQNQCLEQPFLNAYLFRNKIYNTELNNHVSHNGYNVDKFDGTVLHFAGGPGNFEIKYDKMLSFYNKNLIDTRNELLNYLEKNTKVCEIGVFKGEFSKILLEKLQPTELHLVDIFEGTMCSGDKDGNNIVWVNLDDEYKKIINEYQNNKNVTIHKGKSYNILSNFEDEYFDIIYIDGDHTYNGVKKDLEISFNKIKKNGLICGHDYTSPRFQEVVNAVDEFCKNKNLQIDFLTKDGCPTYCITKK